MSFRMHSFMTVSALLLPAALGAQTIDPATFRGAEPPPSRVFTLTSGIGNSLGWFGMQGERYFNGERLSVFAGAGYVPNINEGYPTGIAVAAGLRGYTPGRRHRGFLELSISQVAVQPEPASRMLYGPGVQAGYQLTTSGGFTMMASLGAGYVADTPSYGSSVKALVGLGFGYTWRQ
jgi:hypothetical protein